MLFVARMSLCILSTRNKVTLPRNYIVLSIYKFNYSLADLTDLRRRTTNSKTTLTTICLSLQYNAACCIPLCVICAICGRIFTQEYSIYIAQMKPQCIPLISQIYADKTQNNKTATITQPVFLCVIMQLAAFSLRDLRYLRENKHASIHHEETITHHITTSLFTCCVSR